MTNPIQVIAPVRCKQCGGLALGGAELCAEHEAKQDEFLARHGWKQERDLVWANGLLPGRPDYARRGGMHG